MRFMSKSDENGIAIISNLPVFDRESIQVYHKDFDVPITAGRRTVRVDLKADKVVEVTVTMQKKGAEVLVEKPR